MDVLQLDNATVRKYIPIAGTMAEGYFTRFAPDALRRPLGDVLDVAAVARHYGTLQAMLQDTGLEPLPGLGEEASVCFAFLSGLASLDVNVAQSGLTVTDAQGLSPASQHRVQALRNEVTARAYASLAALFEGLWDAYPHLSPNAQGCLRPSPFRDALCCSPSAFIHAAGWARITAADYFTGVGILREVEAQWAVPLLGPAFYHEQVARATGRDATPVAEPVRCLQTAIYLQAAGLMRGTSELAPFAEARLREARAMLQTHRDQYPLWAGSSHDDGRTPPYPDGKPHASFFLC